MVLYRYPGDQAITIRLQESAELRFPENTGKSGFIISPFDPEDRAFCIGGDTLIHAEEDDFPVQPYVSALESWDIPQSPQFELMISEALDALRTTDLEKVVLSEYLDRPSESSPFILFSRLINHYPRAFCYCWHHPAKGTWLGASPEILIEEQQGVAQIMSLAGTKPVSDGFGPEWTTKEEHEQELVTDYIREVAKTHLSEVVVQPRETTRAGNLYHLKTMITGKRKSDLMDILRDLHPTPAIAGVPRNTALKFIMEHEQYDREFYTGYLGEYNTGSGEKSSIYVNLRCMQWFRDKVQIYVGGGITAGSDIQAEWQELVAKSKTIGAILDK